MREEWPITTAAATGSAKPRPASPVVPPRERLSDVVRDFFLPDALRLTEQERALMTAMLHGLVGYIADELHASLPESADCRCDIDPASLIPLLSAAGLLQDPQLVRPMRRQADVQRIALARVTQRSVVQRWTASPSAEVAAAAMAVITARGRRLDRFGRGALDLSDLPAESAGNLVASVAAGMGRACGAHVAADLDAAAGRVGSGGTAKTRIGEVEMALARTIGAEARQERGLLVSLARDGDAPMIAAILAVEADIPAAEAWRMTVGAGADPALLLRLADIPRDEAADLLANGNRALFAGDPLPLIERYDSLTQGEVDTQRLDRRLTPHFRRARDRLAARG